MILLSGLVLILCGGTGAENLRRTFTVDGDVRQFTVAKNAVYVATDEHLYQLTGDLTLARMVKQKGVLQWDVLGPGKFHRVSDGEKWNSSLKVNVLLPFLQNNTLISCGVTDNKCGYCELLDPANISTILYRENILVGPRKHGSASVTVLVKVGDDTFLLAATEKDALEDCGKREGSVYIHDTNNKKWGVFSISGDNKTPFIESNSEAEFVDGFQIGEVIYLLANVHDAAARNKVRLLWLSAKGSKTDVVNSLRGASLRMRGHTGCKLVASALLPGEQTTVWSGVFSVDVGQIDTEVLLFDLKADPPGARNGDPDFCGRTCSSEVTVSPKILYPERVVFRQRYMTSILAVKSETWIVFYIGTGDGQLIKVALDSNNRTTCPSVIYRTNNDIRLFPNIYFEGEDHKSVYVAFSNKVELAPATLCHTYRTLEECWSAQDPQCVWCGSTSCTFKSDCQGLDWVSIPENVKEKMISYSVEKQSGNGQLNLTIQTHVTANEKARSMFSCNFSKACTQNDPAPIFPKCTCILSNSSMLTEGLAFTVTLGSLELVEKVRQTICPDITGPPTSELCQQCINAGCSWTKNRCSWASDGEMNDIVCQMTGPRESPRPEGLFITPSVVSVHGKNNAVLSGYNLSHVTRVRFQEDLFCKPRESPVWNNTGVSLMFRIPSTKKNGKVKVCVVLQDGSCHGDSSITYVSPPFCTNITPSSSWFSGGRMISITGSHLDITEGVLHSHSLQQTTLPSNFSGYTLTFESPAVENNKRISTSIVSLKVANKSLACSKIIHYPEPQFTSYATTRTGDHVRITIQKKADKLGMNHTELKVWGVHKEIWYPCLMDSKEISNDTEFFICEIRDTPLSTFQHLQILYGNSMVRLQLPSSLTLLLLLLFILPLIAFIIFVVFVVYRHKQKKLTAKMNKLMETLELDIRNDIRQGFVDLQTEKTDLMENVGAIPFLDYKHFASRIFFPESEPLMTLCIRDICQDAKEFKLDECCQDLARLIQNQLFLTSMVHAMEEQKSFTIKDKCTLASLLTVALHGNLCYLTDVMEVLLKDLMRQSSNTQPKLLLRRTESTVEKLLTNWMSICLYGFLRESVGHHLFRLVSALSQQIAKGPVDSVTEKALYTLSEDWLLWQAQDFSPLKLKVVFEADSGGGVSEPLDVNALSCDTVEQVKEKILAVFKAKFGFPYNSTVGNIWIEYERDGVFVPLKEVDVTSEVIGEVTMLNTLKHYKIPDGATIKVLCRKAHPSLSPQGSLKDDQNFSGKYFHLIDPDVDEDQTRNPERKKLKLKEVHLTKLLSTKVAVHSFVENLFHSIWGVPPHKVHHAVKYFFDFLDTQADDMKILDPDVIHIWKTNSLPLRFWINILKNPQFVFDMEKPPHLDGCLSVIAQAFMDSFSLSEIQLGKHAPTNKLLYAKEIPKFKQEVKVYYKQIKDQLPVSDSEFRHFLQEESKKHEHEFNEAAALRELFRFIKRYFKEIIEKLDEIGAPVELLEQLHHVKKLFDGLKTCSWS